MLEAILVPFTAGMLNFVADPVKCNLPDAPQIFVKPSSLPTKYNHRKSIEELSSRQADTISPYPKHAIVQTGGITASQIEVKTSLNFEHQSWRSLGVGCVYFDRIDVTIQLDPTIYVAKDYKKRSCHYGEVLKHEKKHVRVDKEVLNKYARKIGEALRLSINNAPSRGPYPLERLEEIQISMQEYVASVIKTQQSLMEEERFRRQQEVDTFEEYERIRLACE